MPDFETTKDAIDSLTPREIAINGVSVFDYRSRRSIGIAW